MNLLPFALAVGALMALGCGVGYLGMMKLGSRETPQQRLQRLTVSTHPLEQAELELPFMERVLRPWLRGQLQAAGRFVPSRSIEQARRNLMLAAYPRNLTTLDFLGAKILFAVVAGIVGIYLLAARGGSVPMRLAMTVAIMAIGFRWPDQWLGSRVKQRQARLVRQLPDALDMLTICVDAGAGLESAMQRISQKWQNEIATELGKVVAEVGLGMTRREALQNMVRRTDVADIGSFVAVLLQADQFGLSIANVLHTQSEQMRTRRWQRAEEEARKVPIKLLFPLVFLILPAMFAVTIGPSVPVLLRIFGQMGAN
jgi:tight adherence protein C